MRVLLFLFLIVYIIEDLTSALKNVGVKKSAILVETYPKKNNKLHKSLKLNRRYEKSNVKLNTKKTHYNNDYTVFPSHLPKKPLDVPSSPYFPIDPHDEPKLRVKKVLPDFWNTSRRKKREAVGVTSSAAPAASAVSNPASGKSADVKSEANPSETKNSRRSERKSNQREGKTNTKSKSSKKKGRKPKQNKKPGKPKSIGRSRSNNKKSSTNNKKQRNVKASRRLIAARDAIIENYPYVVSIQKDDEHWCTGAILNQRLVITTANCVWKSHSMSRLSIRAGSRHVEQGGQVVRIAQVIKHPNWSIRKGPDNDVALLLTDAVIRFSHSCHAVDLPNRIMMPVFDDAWVASWGTARRDGIYDKQGLTLQVFHARLLDHLKCNNITARYGMIVSEDFICLEQIGHRAPCTRDTGAPAVSDGVLWGMASWGIRKLCGTERFPAMFSYVGSHSNMDFITNATTQLMSQNRLSPFLDRFVPRAKSESVEKPTTQPPPYVIDLKVRNS